MKETMIETFSPEETHALGKKIGQQAKPGDVYTLIGDLGVGKTVFTQGIAEGLGIREPICSRSIILMFTVSGILKRWMRSDMRTIFMEMVCA